ncbi:MAG: hypothetical protein LZF86_40063 [Nitrospira sp.]|nr:MAG: hypothetical protein LZF86_40063 [Nitrospira sp.]
MRPAPSHLSDDSPIGKRTGVPVWDTDLLATVQALYDKGLFVQALETASPLGPLQTWHGIEARVLAGRLASQLSGKRLCDALFIRLWRAEQLSPIVIYYTARTFLSRRGPLAALNLLQGNKVLENDSPIRWDATAFAAYLYAQFRDFDTAERLITIAMAHSVTSWIWTERAAIYELEDRYENALDAARQALDLNPTLPAAILHIAHGLSLLEQDDEAMDLLHRTLVTVESPYLASHLVELEIEHGHYHRALETLEIYDHLAILKDKTSAAWLAGRRSDVYTLLGNHRVALTQARLIKTPYYKEIARNLEQIAPDARRVILPVGFVRQHHMTCAPATLTALSRYWNQPANHLELAEAICYDGTPHHSERRWAANHGWYVREFSVTWNSSRELIDAGIPFTLTTPYPGGSHLQAVIGYDAIRGVLLIRDPYERVYSEFSQASFFTNHAATGPRGMVFVPYAERARLEAIVLPDATLHDLNHEVHDALSVHDRNRAAEAIQTLLRCAPDHRIALNAQRALAGYDDNLQALLQIVDSLADRYPKDINLRLSKANLLRQLVDRGTYLDYLAVQAPAHALLKLRYAQAILEDGRRRHEATRIVETLLRNSTSAEGISTLGDAYWHAGAYRQAVDLYRLAATLEDTNEAHARAYFQSSRTVREEDLALTFLQHRVTKHGARSSQPAITLIHCLSELNRSSEAIAARDQALEQRPDDGELLLFAARSAADCGNTVASQRFLQQAQARCNQVEWLRAAAQLQDMEGNLHEARRLWTEVVTREPFNLKDQRTLVRLTVDTDNRAAAIEYLRGLVRQFPHHQGINELLVEWLDEAPLEEQEAALRQLLNISPANAWGRRQLTLTLAQQGRFEEARAESASAYDLAPDAVAWHTTHGYIELLAGRLAEARAAFRNAFRRSADSDYALKKLLESCRTLEERRDALLFALEELKRQIIVGESLLSFQRLAHGAFESNALMDILDDAQHARPDLWQTWVACIRQRIDMQQYGPARAICCQAIDKFPLLPRLFVELAEVEKLNGDRQAERAALQEALRLSPSWGYATRQLAESLESDGKFSTSREWLEQAIRHTPTDGRLHGFLGYTLWQLQERNESIKHLQEAVRLDIGYDWAWDRLKEYSAAQNQSSYGIDQARRLAAQRPGEPRAWIAVARMAENSEEKLAALERVIRLAPFTIEAHLLRLDLLISEERFDDALTALQTTAWGDRPPVALRIKEPMVLAGRGDQDTAILRLQKILADDPNHTSGWELLADWQSERKDYSGYLVAARELHRIDPNNAYALGYLADALSKAEPNTDVRPHLRRAVHLKADYIFGANWLFDLELQAGALEAADTVLVKLRAHANSGETRLRALRLAICRGVRENVFQVFHEIWTANDDIEIYRETMEALDTSTWKHEANKALEQMVLDSQVNPVAGTLWVERRDLRIFPLMRFRGFGKVLRNGEAGQLAAQTLLRLLGNREATFTIHRLLWKYGKHLASNATTHGMMAYALINIDASRTVVKWFGDWQQRRDSPAWAFLNLSCALRDLGRCSEAHAVSSHALTLKKDQTFAEHSVWLAYDAACEGACANAEKLLAMVDEKSLRGYYRFILAATRLHILIEARTDISSQTMRSARTDMRHAWESSFWRQPILRRIWWKTYMARKKSARYVQKKSS